MLSTLIFASAFMLPCLCSTAMAAEKVEGEASCPCSEKDHENQNHGESCCCGCDGVNPLEPGESVEMNAPAALTTNNLGEEVRGPGSWWSPELLVALWLLERVEFVEDELLPPSQGPPELYSDHSETYLEHSTLLI